MRHVWELKHSRRRGNSQTEPVRARGTVATIATACGGAKKGDGTPRFPWLTLSGSPCCTMGLRCALPSGGPRSDTCVKGKLPDITVHAADCGCTPHRMHMSVTHADTCDCTNRVRAAHVKHRTMPVSRHGCPRSHVALSHQDACTAEMLIQTSEHRLLDGTLKLAS